MSSELLVALLAGAVALALPLLMKLGAMLRKRIKAKLEDALDSPLMEGVATNIVETVLLEAEDALVKVLKEAAARAKDGKLDEEDRKALLALLREETVGELKRQLSRLKK